MMYVPVPLRFNCSLCEVRRRVPGYSICLTCMGRIQRRGGRLGRFFQPTQNCGSQTEARS